MSLEADIKTTDLAGLFNSISSARFACPTARLATASVMAAEISTDADGMRDKNGPWRHLHRVAEVDGQFQ